MLQFNIDSEPSVQQIDSCQTCCCESLSLKPGTVTKVTLDFSMWVLSIGRLHCEPQFVLEQQDTCPVSVGTNLPPQPAPKVSFDTPMNTVLTGDLRSQVTDPDGDTITFKRKLPFGPSYGKVDIDPSGSFIYTPYTSFTGIDRFYASASDGINAPVVFEVIIGVGTPGADAPSTPHVSVLTEGVQIDYRFNKVSFPIHVSPAALTCEIWKLTVYQNAIDCECQCYSRNNCFDIRVVKC